MDDFENLDDDQIQQLIALGIIPDEENQLQQQIEQAKALRNAEAPSGRYVRGGIYVAASPLEHIARAAQGIKAQHDLKDLYQRQQDLFGQQVQGRQSYFDALRNRLRVGKGSHSYTIPNGPLEDISLDPNLVQPPNPVY